MDPSQPALNARQTTRTPGSFWKAALALVRPEYIPTVLSNCVAGWWLGGGGNTRELLIVLSGAVVVFVAGALLNDAFDVRFDRLHRRARPIPAGTVRLRSVWRFGLLLLLAGTLYLQVPGRVTGGIAMALALAVVMHNSMHRLMPLSPVLVGLCRFLLYLLGASVAGRGITGTVLWCAIAIACGGTGLAAWASKESRWWLLCLVPPFVVAMVLNTSSYLPPAAAFALVLAAWLVLSGQFLDRPFPGSFSVASVILMDMLAACPARIELWSDPQSLPGQLTLFFFVLFAASLLLSVARAPLSKCGLPQRSGLCPG